MTFPDRFFDLIAREGLFRTGTAALDLGTGDGALALGMAARGAMVLGLDPDARRLATARDRAREAKLAARFEPGLAERSGQPDAAFDLVTAARSWHWFDRALAAAEAHRVLKPGGALLICHDDWIVLPGNLAHATEFLIEAHNPRWRLGHGTGFYPAWAMDLALAGFRDIGFAGFDHDIPFTPEDWRAQAAASVGADVSRFDAELSAMLDARFPGEKLVVPHRLFAIWGRRG